MKEKNLFFLFFTIFAVWVVARLFFAFNFYYNCESHLVNAVSAESAKTANQELSKATNYLTTHNLTSGQISIFRNKPSNDIGLWYKNLNNSIINSKNTILRKNIFDIKVIHPSGISIYPHNTLFLIWGVLSIIGSIFWGFLYFIQYQINTFFNQYF